MFVFALKLNKFHISWYNKCYNRTGNNNICLNIKLEMWHNYKEYNNNNNNNYQKKKTLIVIKLDSSSS